MLRYSSHMPAHCQLYGSISTTDAPVVTPRQLSELREWHEWCVQLTQCRRCSMPPKSCSSAQRSWARTWWQQHHVGEVRPMAGHQHACARHSCHEGRERRACRQCSWLSGHRHTSYASGLQVNNNGRRSPSLDSPSVIDSGRVLYPKARPTSSMTSTNSFKFVTCKYADSFCKAEYRTADPKCAVTAWQIP